MKATAVIFLALIATAGVSARELQKAGTSSSSSASVSCSATSSSGVSAKVVNTITKTVAIASASLCGAGGDIDVVMAKAFVAWRGAAKAMVSEWAAVSAGCTTSDHSFACARSNAAAHGRAVAIQKIVSEAVASAVAKCGRCLADADAQVWAKTIVGLIAKATGRAQADVCIGPNATAYAAAYEACTASVIAHGCAIAQAEAYIRGGCTKLSADALARVKTISKADPFCMCKGWVYTCAATPPRTCAWGLKKDSVMGRARGARELGAAGNAPVSNTADAFFINECKAAAQQIHM